MSQNPLIELKTTLDYPKIKANQIKEAIDYWIEQINLEIKQLHQLSSTDPKNLSWENCLQNFLNQSNQLWRAYSVASHFNVVMDSPEIREVYEDAMIKAQKLSDQIDQDKKIYQCFLSLYQTNQALNQAQKRVLDLEIKKYQKQGVHLEEKKRKRLKAINQSLAKLSLKFEQNILDDANQFSLLIEQKEQLKGLTDSLINRFKAEAEKQNQTGYLITLSQPNVIAILQSAENQDLRKKIHRAWSTRSNQGQFNNQENINEILKLRDEKSKLLGFDDYCHYVLSERMAKNYHSVEQLLTGIAKKAKSKAELEFKALEQFAKENLALDSLKSYDISFASQKLKEATFGFNDEMLKAYFPVTKVMDCLFDIIKELYGIEFKPANYSVWDDKVKSYQIYKQDQQDQSLGVLYVDLYARSTKRSGAWMSDYQSYLEPQYHNQSQIPVAYINMNFMDNQDGESYLSFEDVLTLFHEAGHGLHHLLTKVGLFPIAGINGVQWDAVELPSQLMENFCYNWHYLKAMTAHQKTAEPISFELFNQIIAAKNQFSGLFLIRQIILGLFDLKIHAGENHKNWQKVLDQLRSELSVYQPENYESPAHSFSHIFAGGYASGYYSYLWADILSSDVYGAFVEQSEVQLPEKLQSNNQLDNQQINNQYFAKTANPTNGSHFLDAILSQGAIKDAAELFYQFRGREPNAKYLYQSYGVSE